MKAVCPPQNRYKSNRNGDGETLLKSLHSYLVSTDAVAKLGQFACLNLPGYFHLAVKYAKEQTKTNKQSQETYPLNLF